MKYPDEEKWSSVFWIKFIWWRTGTFYNVSGCFNVIPHKYSEMYDCIIFLVTVFVSCPVQPRCKMIRELDWWLDRHRWGDYCSVTILYIQVLSIHIHSIVSISILTQTSTRINHHLHKNKFQLDTHNSFDWINISLISLGRLREIYRHVWKCPQTDRLADMGLEVLPQPMILKWGISWGCWRSPSLLLPPVDMKPRYHEAAWFILHPSCTSLAASDIWYKGWTWLDRKHCLTAYYKQPTK